MNKTVSKIATPVNPNAVILSPQLTGNDELFYINGSQGKLAAKLSLPDLQSGEKCPMVIFGLCCARGA